MANYGSNESRMAFLFTPQGWPYLLVPFIPVAIGLDIAHADRKSVV